MRGRVAPPPRWAQRASWRFRRRGREVTPGQVQAAAEWAGVAAAGLAAAGFGAAAAHWGRPFVLGVLLAMLAAVVVAIAAAVGRRWDECCRGPLAGSGDDEEGMEW